MPSPTSIVTQIPGLRRYARALTGDAWAADDLVQDTLERACSKWHLWRAGSDLRAWLFTLMHNQFVSGYRRNRRQPENDALPLDGLPHEVPAPDSSTHLALDLQTCLNRLPVEQREALLLVALEGLAYEDVARVTGVPLGTVMSRVSRARSRMRECMGHDEHCNAQPVDEVATLRRIK